MDFNLNLNDNSLFAGNNSIFNNGEVGRVTNVTMTLEKKAADDFSNQPPFKFVFTDNSGASINLGYFRFEPMPGADETQNQQAMRNKFQTLVSIARCVIPTDFQFPDTTGLSTEQVENMLMQTIENNISDDKKVNIFATYGTKKNPSQYLRVRGYNFIEPAFVEAANSRLKVDNRYDNMERLVADAPKSDNSGFGGVSQQPASNNNQFWS